MTKINRDIISITLEDDNGNWKMDGGHQKEVMEDTLRPNQESSAFLLDLDLEKSNNGDSVSSGLDSEDSDIHTKPHHQQETFLSILFQIIVPFFLAGCGTVGAGLILDIVQHSIVFQEVPQIIILVPALLGLKGNIEMTLASRLSTEANMGNLKTTKAQIRLVLGNIFLVQFQAIAVGFVASISPYWMGSSPDGIQHALLLSASSVVTTSLASFFLGILMSIVVILSRKYNINPDNVAAPLAASIGDIVTLSLLYLTSSLIYKHMDKYPWIAPTVLGFFALSLILWFYLTYKHKFTREVLIAPSTWLPIIGGMIISCFAGKIFDHSVKMFKKIAVLQPVMNGVGGNLAAVQASRISTYLHCHCKMKSLPAEVGAICGSPLRTFYDGIHGKSAFALLLLLVPGHVIFVNVIWFVHPDLNVTLVFMTFYIMAAVIQVLILLYLVDILVHYFWQLGIDPDNAAIPCLTSIGDFLGTLLLLMAFQISYFLQGGDSDEGLLAYLQSSH